MTQKKWQLHVTHSYTGYTAKNLAFYKYFVYFTLIDLQIVLLRPEKKKIGNRCTYCPFLTLMPLYNHVHVSKCCPIVPSATTTGVPQYHNCSYEVLLHHPCSLRPPLFTQRKNRWRTKVHTNTCGFLRGKRAVLTQ